MKKTIELEQLERKYNLEFEKIISEIMKKKAKLVLLQFPDGLKPWGTKIVDFLESRTQKIGTEFLIWFGSCYGACDTPLLGKELEKKVDLVVQFGHNSKMPDY